MSMKSIVQAIETGVTHFVQTVETDAATGEQKIIGFFHVLKGDMPAALAKAQAEATVELAKIDADAKAAATKVQEKLASIKAGLGL